MSKKANENSDREKQSATIHQKKEYEEIRKHRIISLHKLDQYKLFASDVCFPCLSCKSSRLRKHQTMLDIGRQKLMSELDMCKIIKDLRAMKLFVENQWADEQYEHLMSKLRHQDTNVINIEG